MSRTTPQVREQMRFDREWSLHHELLAQLVEEVSIVATRDHRRRKPREVPRPNRPTSSDGRGGVARAVAVLKRSRRTVYPVGSPRP